MPRRLVMLLPGASIVDATPEQFDAIAKEMVRRGRAEPDDPEAGPAVDPVPRDGNAHGDRRPPTQTPERGPSA
ncbi:MAG: hypothetical protein U0667_04955 [Chloroflexota bacterium]